MALDKKWKETIHADGVKIAVLSGGDDNNYISLTDIVRYKSDEPNDVIRTGCAEKILWNFLDFGNN